MFRRTASDLGFDSVLNTISSLSLSTEGSVRVLAAKPICDKKQLVLRQRQVSDVISALIECESDSFNAEFFPDLKSVFDFMVKNPTAPLDGESIYNVALFIGSAQRLRKIFERYTDNPNLIEGDIRTILPELDTELIYLEKEIHKVLESPGKVKESYPTVRALIDKAESCRNQRTREAHKMMRSNASFMQEDKAVLRDGRIVLPVKAELKSQMDGYIQGTSQTKSTLFMEPFKLVDLNNEVNLAVQEIEIEIARLLAMLSDLVRQSEEKLRILSSQVAEADFLFSFASWIRKNNCAKTVFEDKYVCNLIKARHPLLKEKCVPIDLMINADYKAVVLTGPNAGGKTVTMKTVGLFSLLNQVCGYMPASDGSSMAIFDRVFTDIGDDQSIENQLSTFSGHMKSIGFILRSITDNSLVILDELGSGTDPQEGAALARSILEYAIKKAKLTLTTSHHGVLKQFAYAAKDVLNASMEFDEKTLEPTFKVINGLPGDSHAIDTAKRMHLPKTVTSNAQKYMGQEAVKISSIIKGLEAKRKEARDMEEEITSRLNQVKKIQKELDEKERELQRFENHLKKDELREFDEYLNDSRRKLETLVKEIREGEITREKTLKVKEHILALEKEKGAKEEELQEREKDLDQKDYDDLLKCEDNVELEVGMDVLCGPYRREGTVVKKEKNGRFVVAIGPMKFTFKETELAVPVRSKKDNVRYSYDISSSTPRPKLNLDLRGFRLLEALEAIDNEIESCCVHGISGFTIVHGYGDGILSTGIHKHLSMNANVSEYHFAHPDDGGQGKTYVKLRT